MESQAQSKSYLKALAKGQYEMKNKAFGQKMSFWPTLAHKTHENKLSNQINQQLR